MRMRWFLAAAGLVAMLPASRSEAMQLEVSRMELCSVSDAVVVGTVADLETFWAAGLDGGIERRAMLDISHTLRGEPMSAAELLLPGGKIGENWHHVEDVPELEQGDRYLLFLHRISRGYEVIGGFQGAVPIAGKLQKGEPLTAVLADMEGCHGK